MKTKQQLKEKGFNIRWILSVLIGIVGGSWIISEIEVMIGFYNNTFFIFFACLYAGLIAFKFNKLFYSENKKEEYDKPNISSWI